VRNYVRAWRFIDADGEAIYFATKPNDDAELVHIYYPSKKNLLAAMLHLPDLKGELFITLV
jgi:hypothetical protein